MAEERINSNVNLVTESMISIGWSDCHSVDLCEHTIEESPTKQHKIKFKTKDNKSIFETIIPMMNWNEEYTNEEVGEEREIRDREIKVEFEGRNGKWGASGPFGTEGRMTLEEEGAIVETQSENLLYEEEKKKRIEKEEAEVIHQHPNINIAESSDSEKTVVNEYPRVNKEESDSEKTEEFPVINKEENKPDKLDDDDSEKTLEIGKEEEIKREVDYDSEKTEEFPNNFQQIHSQKTESHARSDSEKTQSLKGKNDSEETESLKGGNDWRVPVYVEDKSEEFMRSGWVEGKLIGDNGEKDKEGIEHNVINENFAKETANRKPISTLLNERNEEEEEEMKKLILKIEFWKQYPKIEIRMYLAATLFLPIIWILSTLLPIFFITSCQDGHDFVAHITIFVFALLIVLIDIYLNFYFKRLIDDVTPSETLADERLYTNFTLLEKLKRNKTFKFLFFETLTLLAYYDYYTDMCFITISNSSEDTILWKITTAVMVVANFPRLISYGYFQYQYYKIERHDISENRVRSSVDVGKVPDITEDYGYTTFSHNEGGEGEEVGDDTEIKAIFYTYIPLSESDEKLMRKRLLTLLTFLRWQELKGFSEPLRFFGSNHKIFASQDIKEDKYMAMFALLWKTLSEDAPQLTCQFIYVLFIEQMCPQNEKVNPVILVSIVLSLLMSVVFTLMAVAARSKSRLYYWTFLSQHELKHDQYRALEDKKKPNPDQDLVYLSKILPLVNSLKVLNLEKLNIGNKGAKALGAVFAKAQHLRTINLWGNKIGNEGVEELRKGVEDNRKINHINLCPRAKLLIKKYEKHKESDFQVMKKIINFHMDKLVLTSKDETGSVMPLKNKCSHMYSVFQCLKMWKNPAANYVTFDFNSPIDIHTSDKYLKLANLSAEAIINLLKNGKNLEFLRLKGAGFAYNQMSLIFKEVNSCNSLQHLSIMEVMLTPQDLFVLKDHLRYNRHLHTLSLVNNNIGEVGIVVFVECLKLNNFLQELTITKNNFRDHAAAEIAKALGTNQRLEKIYLEANHMTDVGAKKINDALVENPSKNFNFCYIDEEEVTEFPFILNPTASRLRSLEKTVAGKEKMFDILHNYLTGNMQLEKLSLAKKYFNETQMKEMCRSLGDLPKLKYLFLSHNTIGPNSAKSLGSMIVKTKSLETLRLDNNALRGETKQIIQGMLSNISILILNLSNNYLDKNIGKKIGVFLGSDTRLKQLDLSNNIIKDEGAAAIGEGLATNNHLKSLNLNMNEIKEDGAKAFAKGYAKNANILNDLNFSNNECTDDGIIAIAQVLGIGMVALNFNETKFGLTGTKALATFLMKAENLENLYIKNNVLSDLAIRYLTQGIIKNKSMSLKRIDFSSNIQSKDEKGRDKISYKGALLIEKAIKKHTGIMQVELAGQNIPQVQLELIQNECKTRVTVKRTGSWFKRQGSISSKKKMI